MQVPALLLLILPALPPLASTTNSGQPCPSEMNKVKDLLEVNCTEQGLSAVPPGLPKDTGILLLSTNNLTSLSIDAFLPLTQLQDLDLSDNGLVALHTGALLPSLKELILSHNLLQKLPALQGMPALTRLALAHNSLGAVPSGAFRAVPRLQDLDLRGNKLRTLPPEAFAELRALKDLDLSDNLLEELPKELLQDLQQLETLWLSGNRLQTLPNNFFPEGHIFMYVFLTENPWHCDCQLQYLRLWIRQNEDSVYQPERGLEKTKVEVAPEKVLCHSPTMHQRKPIIHFKPNCGNVGDADEEEDDDYDYGEVTEKATVVTLPPHPSTPKEHTTMPQITTRLPLNTRYSSTLTPSTLFAMPTSTRAASTTTSPASASPTTPALASPTTSALASPTTTPTQTPSTAAMLSAAPLSPSHTHTTLISTTSLPATVSTTSPSTSSHPQAVLAASTTNTFANLMMSPGTIFTTSASMASTAAPETSSALRSSSPSLTSTTLAVSTTMLSTCAPTPSAPLDTRSFTQPAPSPPPALLPFCPCSIPAPVLRSQAGGGAPQWGQWVLRHCCLLHWVLYLVSLVLLFLTLLALAGCLAWMCLVGRSSWHKPLQIQEAQYLLLRRRESTGSPVMHLSSFKSPLQRTMFCTIKEVELCPQVTYCTIKDLGIQHNPPASSSFCTTKELWVHHSPPDASFSSFSGKLMVTNLRSLRTPSAYSLDRGVKAISEVRVKYASNTL